ncbi:hypothetical protein R1sor_012586 [Riccia sorocarpa]|uniref:Uncharacterized protein n=1 Tax=Riccia sorocarpa TaxID=122646 RepID=A0ABD3I7Z0_9MARC
MSPPRTFFADFPYPAAKRSTSQLGVQDQNTQEEDEDAGPFEAEVLSDNDDDRSYEGVLVAVRRFKETLREPKPPRPSDGKYHLPNNFTKKEVYDHYKTDMVQMQETDAVEALKLHRKQQAEERATASRRLWKALDSPKDFAYIQIDGMDQKKTALPHFSTQPKSVDGAALVGVHLVGAMIFHSRLHTRNMCWFWPVRPERNVDNDEEPTAVTTAEELKRRIFGQRRPIYSGPRRPPLGSAAADRAAHIGELTDVQEKSFLVVLAEDEICFWICQVLKIKH